MQFNEKYLNLLKRLYNTNRFKNKKVDLTMIENACRLFNNPQNNINFIHVTGTNGKGSVCKKLSSILSISNFKTGLFTSPHITTFRERIQIDNKHIEEEYIISEMENIFKICDKNSLDLTYFELVTLLSFLYFKEKKVDIAVIEVGLGGNLDATNIIDPILSVITSIGLDHTDSLGFTQLEIAEKKAGIIKTNRPSIIGPDCYPKETFINKAMELNSQIHIIDKKIRSKNEFFNYDLENRDIVLKAIDILNDKYLFNIGNEAVKKGISINQSCRNENALEVLGQEYVKFYIKSTFNMKVNFDKIKAIILDVGHNQHGLEKFFLSIKEKYPSKNIYVVCGFSSNKDKFDIFRTICSYSDRIYLTSAKHPRAIEYDELYRLINEFFLNYNYNRNLIDKNDFKGDVTKSILKALNDCYNNEIVIICGTFFMMREARWTLGYKDEIDPYELNEINTISFKN